MSAEGNMGATSTNDRVSDAPTADLDFSDTFRKIDLDGSGSITKEELWDHVGDSTGLSKKDFDVLFGVIDQDKSGAIDNGEYNHFMSQVKHKTDGAKRRHSCMKVPTQRASIARPMKKDKQHHSHRRGLSRSMLKSTRKQHSFRGKDFNFDESLPKAEPQKPTSVRFFDVEVREYGVTASDNPGVKAGVALELSWDYNVLERSHLDTFEEKRSKERSPNFKREKKLSKFEREKILQEWGASRKEMEDATKRAASIRNARKKSINVRQHDAFYESVEGKTRFAKKLMGIGRRKSKSAPPANTVDIGELERLHPTLMAMMGIDDSSDQDKPESQSS